MKETVCRDVARNVSTIEKIVEIENENPKLFNWQNIYEQILEKIHCVKDKYIVKLNLVKTTENKLYFQVVYIEGFNGVINEPFAACVQNKSSFSEKEKNITCIIVPTGIGARFGGYAGDANPLAKLFAKSNEYLLTHPNVVNGAVLSDLPSNLIYLEGFLLDQFLLGNISIKPNKKNKIGVIFDKGITEERMDYEVNVLNALKAYYGCEIIGYSVTSQPLKITPYINNFGFSSGEIHGHGLDYLIEKALTLKNSGATALALCCAIQDLDLNKNYINGCGIDPIGGVESIISRTVSAASGLVSAHAPVLLADDSVNVNYKDISCESASEYIAKTFLPSVISGLRYAPKIVLKEDHGLTVQNIEKIVLPYNAFGNPGVFYLSEYFNKIYLVRENETCLDVNPDHLNIHFNFVKEFLDLIDKKSFKECGIDPMVLKRPINSVQQL